MLIMKKFIITILKFIWNILKHILFLPMYSSFPDKYNGIDYDEWLDKNKL